MGNLSIERILLVKYGIELSVFYSYLKYETEKLAIKNKNLLSQGFCYIPADVIEADLRLKDYQQQLLFKTLYDYGILEYKYINEKRFFRFDGDL